MSNSKSDKPLALKTIFACLLVIAIFYVLFATFSHQVAGNFKNGIYVTGVIVFGILFFLASIWAYQSADDGGTNDNKSRAVVIALTVIIICWAGGWVAGSNEKVAPGSPQMEDIR
jgi:hypothetical protein